MTVAELIAQLQKHPPTMEVRYNYDGGNSYPTFVDVYEHTVIEEHGYDIEDTIYTFVCLDECYRVEQKPHVPEPAGQRPKAEVLSEALASMRPKLTSTFEMSDELVAALIKRSK